MRRSTLTIVGAMIASAGFATSAMGASAVYNLGDLFVPDLTAPFETAIPAPGVNPTKAVFSTDWVAGGGDPWSNEAIWAVTDAPLNTATDFYFDFGSAPNSASSGASTTLNWAGYRGGYDPLPDISGNALNFIAGQAFDFSDAFWNNSVLTLSDDVAAAPSSFIDLGAVAGEFEPFSIDTFGSGMDTELGFFNHAGGLAEANDDAGGGLESELLVPGLPAGDYFFNVGGFNTNYGEGGFEALVGSSGSDGGDFVINISSLALPSALRSQAYAGTLDADTNQFFRITIVPTPGTAAILGVVGLAGIRRRR